MVLDNQVGKWNDRESFGDERWESCVLRVLTTKLYNGEYAPSFASIFSEARLSQADEAWDHSSGGTQTTK